jgi:hypothetical protein
MRNSCNQISTLSNIAEIVKNESRGSFTPLRWSKFGRSFILIPHSAEVPRITKINSGKNHTKNFTYFFVLGEVTRCCHDLLRSLMCVHKTFKWSCGRIFL